MSLPAAAAATSVRSLGASASRRHPGPADPSGPGAGGDPPVHAPRPSTTTSTIRRRMRPVSPGPGRSAFRASALAFPLAPSRSGLRSRLCGGRRHDDPLDAIAVAADVDVGGYVRPQRRTLLAVGQLVGLLEREA